MLRKLLNVEKLKFEFYHIHFKIISVFSFEHAILKHDLCITSLFETMWSKVNLVDAVPNKYFEYRSYCRKRLNNLKTYCCDSSDNFWTSFCTTRDAHFYHACCASPLSHVFLYGIEWALILEYLFFYRDVYVRGMVEFLANLPQHHFIVYMTFIYLNHILRKLVFGIIYANNKGVTGLNAACSANLLFSLHYASN